MTGSRRRLFLLALPLLTCLGLVGSTQALASTPAAGHWTRPAQIDNVALYGVSCATAVFCMAVDRDGRYVAFDGTAWSSPQLIKPKVSLDTVSCPTSTFCMGVTGWGDSAAGYMFDGSSWSAVGAIPGPIYIPRHLSCPNTSFCEVIDGVDQTAEFASGAWSNTGEAKLPPPTGILSCGGKDFCLAGQYEDEVSIFRKAGWSANHPPPLDNHLAGIACPERTFCLAIGDTGDAASYDGQIWTSIDGPHNFLTRVACPRAGLCVVTNNSGSSVTLRGTTWGTPVQMPHEQGTDMITDISCPTGRFCMAVDKRGRATTYR